MSWVRRVFPVVVVCLPTVLVPAEASSQDARLKPATLAASAAAAADWASTYHALKYYQLRESNPILQPWQRSPGRLISMGSVIDAGTVTAWNLTIGRKHPGIAVAGLWGMAAFRAYLAIHNLRNERKTPRRSAGEPAKR
jgi:hypothetical protein